MTYGEKSFPVYFNDIIFYYTEICMYCWDIMQNVCCRNWYACNWTSIYRGILNLFATVYCLWRIVDRNVFSLLISVSKFNCDIAYYLVCINHIQGYTKDLKCIQFTENFTMWNFNFLEHLIELTFRILYYVLVGLGII